jgi:hypothetical protein
MLAIPGARPVTEKSAKPLGKVTLAGALLGLGLLISFRLLRTVLTTEVRVAI